jgi:hypothetical protein
VRRQKHTNHPMDVEISNFIFSRQQKYENLYLILTVCTDLETQKLVNNAVRFISYISRLHGRFGIPDAAKTQQFE